MQSQTTQRRTKVMKLSPGSIPPATFCRSNRCCTPSPITPAASVGSIQQKSRRKNVTVETGEGLSLLEAKVSRAQATAVGVDSYALRDLPSFTHPTVNCDCSPAQSTIESRLAAISLTAEGEPRSPSAEPGAALVTGESASSSSSSPAVRPLLSVSMPSASLSVPCRHSPLLPKLIFLDLHMPVLDGFQTALAIRRMGFDCPIVALTASVGSADQQTAERLGFLRYLTKPISRTQLREALQIAVEHGNVAADAMQRHVAQVQREKSRSTGPSSGGASGSQSGSGSGGTGSGGTGSSGSGSGSLSSSVISPIGSSASPSTTASLTPQSQSAPSAGQQHTATRSSAFWPSAT